MRRSRFHIRVIIFMSNSNSKPSDDDSSQSHNKGSASITSKDTPDKKQTKSGKKKEKESWRETVESIVIAFILAFLFRTFEAEAFVIPTGSMAPTLYGRNKQADCEKCGFHITVGASDEVDSGGGLLNGRVHTAICPNCRYENEIKSAPVSNGDRILVNKFPFEFFNPDRFDVIVFKFPNNPQTNYIKRLAGLPGETIRIHNGDLFKYTEKDGEQILRKQDPNKQDSIQIVHYDDRHPSKELLEKGWPERWSGMTFLKRNTEYGGWQDNENWTSDPTNRTHEIQADTASELAWLRYRNIIPTEVDWDDVSEGRKLSPKPRLISDFCGYNQEMYIDEFDQRRNRVPTEEFIDNVFWVGDLTVSGEVELSSVGDNGQLVIELVEGIYHFRCSLDLKTGELSLIEINAQEDFEETRTLATVATSYTGEQTLKFRMANVDDRICLWLNGSLVDFEGNNLYTRSAISGHLPTKQDLTPIGIAVQNCSAKVSELVIKRDIYYQGDSGASAINFKSELRNHLDDPIAWGRIYNNDKNRLDYFQQQIPEDEFFVLGDNSPRSSDGRLWTGTHTVPRSALVGKAFWIYWPPAIPFGGPDGNGWAINYHTFYDEQGQKRTDRSYPYRRFPFLPNVWRMHRIR